MLTSRDVGSLQLEGCWLAMPKLAPVILKLIADMEERKRKQSPEQRKAEHMKIVERIRCVRRCFPRRSAQ